MDREAWRVAVHGATKSWTQLSDQHFPLQVSDSIPGMPDNHNLMKESHSARSTRYCYFLASEKLNNCPKVAQLSMNKDGIRSQWNCVRTAHGAGDVVCKARISGSVPSIFGNSLMLLIS